MDDRESTSGGVFYLGESPVAWISKKQTLVSLSTTESEYIAVVVCCTQVMCMKQIVQGMKKNPVSLFLSDETIQVH